MGSAITDAQGNLVSSGAGIPAFVGMLDKATKRLFETFKTKTLYPGDILAVNDPYKGGVTHLNDMVLAQPCFVGDTIVAWTVNIAHWQDVGGKSPGSMSADATDLFQVPVVAHIFLLPKSPISMGRLKVVGIVTGGATEAK